MPELEQEVDVQAPVSPTVKKTAKVIASEVPSGNLMQTYGVPMGGAAVIVIALLDFLKSQGSASGQILALFGPRWVFFTCLLVIVWDLMRRLLKLAGRAVAHIGELAENTGAVAAGVQTFAAKNDRTAEEQQRLTSFSVSSSQRSVEIATESLSITRRLAEKFDDHAKTVEKIAEKVGIHAGS